MTQVSIGDTSFELYRAIETHRTAALDIETRANDEQEQRAGDALSYTRGHISVCTVHEPVTGMTEVVRLHIRDHAPLAYPKLLTRILQDPSTVKIFHHARFDLGFLSVAYQLLPESCVCTRVAEKILHPGHREKGFYSLQSLIKRYQAIDIDKGYALSDWDAPELLPSQIRYADEDVRYLPAIFSKQAAVLHCDPVLASVAYRTFGYLPSSVVLEARYGSPPESLFHY
ncbi:MAG: hypothetical protein ACXWQ5_00940 [Ktedonobacterales bacterium]